jgi:hypothetical protein
VTPLLDTRFIIESAVCSCGNAVLRVQLADGRRELRCEGCGIRRGLLSDRTTDFVLAICRSYGAPERPIILRRPQQANTA